MSEKVTVMPPKSLGFGFAVLIKSLLLTLAGVSAYAQVQPNIEGGMHAFGSYHGGEVDAVSLSNGNVLYKIPLLSYPQRGGRLGIEYFLAGNAKKWQVALHETAASNGGRELHLLLDGHQRQYCGCLRDFQFPDRGGAPDQDGEP